MLAARQNTVVHHVGNGFVGYAAYPRPLCRKPNNKIVPVCSCRFGVSDGVARQISPKIAKYTVTHSYEGYRLLRSITGLDNCRPAGTWHGISQGNRRVESKRLSWFPLVVLAMSLELNCKCSALLRSSELAASATCPISRHHPPPTVRLYKRLSLSDNTHMRSGYACQ